MNIDWRVEALRFANENDTRNHMVVQLVEKAMKEGAAIMAGEATKKVVEVREDLQRARIAGHPRIEQSKTIEL
jgi:hypothetical protein